MNAGTVEFLLETAGDRAGEHVFIEMNPRIQVEHTVTEEITDVDLVAARSGSPRGRRSSSSASLQERDRMHGAALQCRVTTENPADGFRPDTGRITAYRSPGGAGVRLDGGTINPGTEVSPHFDSMLAKVTCRGRDLDTAIRRAHRAVSEFRIRGVATNIPFLLNLLDNPEFRSGDVSTHFIDEHPELTRINPPKDRASKVLSWLADVTVNKPNGSADGVINPAIKLPGDRPRRARAGRRAPAAAGARARAAGRSALRERTSLAVTETTFRDAHQSLLATRVRTADLVAVAPHVARMTPQLLSMEAWGGATYDVALRFLGEDPWERLARIRARCRTSRCRCCSAAATRWATPPTRPR